MLDDTAARVANDDQTETIRPVMGGPVSPPDALNGSEPPDESAGSAGAAHNKPRKRWYAVQHDAFLGAYARRSILAQGFRVHWPREVVRRRRHDDVLQPLFQPYLFVELDITRPWANVLHAGGVVTILGIREFGAPIAAPVGEIESLILRAGGRDDGWIDATDDAEPRAFRTADTLDAGQEITFLDGALFGRSAVVSVDRGRYCLDAMMRMFGMDCRTRVRRDRVKPRSANETGER